ncbi:SdpI family protein [Microbacterium sp. KSW-18]|uniref:SdpI family protein n=1 Tax=Microbacterium aquilitoris TaxID=3067307 RepID=A0ABU3GK44_9MICO|nr:SdpI family protein [Microbacterium sp. KSW-18]MDT3330735.1 SdpI family protein [Microbacterium sp. KSW-18]
MDDLGIRFTILILLAAMGVLLIWVATAAASGRLTRNHIAGIRIPSTMASDEAWLAAHIRAKRPTVWGGVAALVAGLCAFLPVPTESLSIVVIGASVVVLACVLYGARVGSRAAVEVERDKRRAV